MMELPLVVSMKKGLVVVGTPLVIAFIAAVSFTPADIATILGAVGVLVGIIAGAVVKILDAIAVNAKETADKIAEVKAKTEVIEGHVNSAATRAEAMISALQNELRLMREVATEKKEIAATLAAAVATAGSAAAAVPSALTGPVVEQALGKIDDNTAAIERNTARTDASVQDLKQKS